MYSWKVYKAFTNAKIINQAQFYTLHILVKPEAYIALMQITCKEVTCKRLRGLKEQYEQTV